MLSNATKDRLLPLVIAALAMGRTSPTDPNCNNILECQMSKGVHLIDEQTLIDRALDMHHNIWPNGRGTDLFAVKGNTNHHLLAALRRQGFRFDCSSPAEVWDAVTVGAKSGEIMYTANATPWEHLKFAMSHGAIINLDDACYLDIMEEMPETLSFRVNIGELRQGEGQDKIIGTAGEQKYGVPYEKLVSAFSKAKNMGVKNFGLHTMYTSNNRSWSTHLVTLKILLEMARQLECDLGIRLELINAGGGIGVDYKHPLDPSVLYEETDKPFDLVRYGREVNILLNDFELVYNWRPSFYLECARFVAAPAGVWIAPIVSITEKYRRFACMEACDGADLLRAGIYPAHRHVIILDSQGREVNDRDIIKQSIVGPLCENIHAVSERFLPEIHVSDLAVFCDAACHGIEMGMNYNSWTKSAQVMRMRDGSLKLISRAQTVGDIRALQVPLN